MLDESNVYTKTTFVTLQTSHSSSSVLDAKRENLHVKNIVSGTNPESSLTTLLLAAEILHK